MHLYNEHKIDNWNKMQFAHCYNNKAFFLVLRKINKQLSALPYIKQMLSTREAGLNSNKYLSLAEFEVCTVSNEACFFLLQ